MAEPQWFNRIPYIALVSDTIFPSRTFLFHYYDVRPFMYEIVPFLKVCVQVNLDLVENVYEFSVLLDLSP